MSALQPWPYPFWIAHRGAGKLAPENTLVAFRTGARHGFRMFECDVKLSTDGVPFLLHDTALERTTNGQGVAGAQAWGALARLDAGSWHSRQFAGEPLPTLDNLARWCLRNGHFLDLEIKPTPGEEAATGRAAAAAAARLWAQAATPPLLTSFKPEALQAAAEAAPQLPRGLLLDTLWDGCFERAAQLACVALVCHHALWSAALVARAHSLGLRALSYTVNDECEAARLIALRTNGIVTDRIDLFSPVEPPQPPA